MAGASDKLCIIAGGGALPQLMIDASIAADRPFFLVRLKGFFDAPEASFAALDNAEIGLGEVGKIFAAMKEHDCSDAVFVGNVKRPDFSALKLDLRGARLLPRIIKAAQKGDGAMLDLLVHEVERAGYNVLGADEVAAPLLARAGAYGQVSPNETDHADILKAKQLLDAIGPFDVGQGAVIADGFVLGVEAAEGTDNLLERCAKLPDHMGAQNGRTRRGVLVKRPKPQQERRIDLPTIGPQTIALAAAANLAGIAIEAGGGLVIDEAELVANADQHGLFVFGFDSHIVANS